MYIYNTMILQRVHHSTEQSLQDQVHTHSYMWRIRIQLTLALYVTSASTCVAELTEAPAWRSTFTTLGYPWVDANIRAVSSSGGEVEGRERTTSYIHVLKKYC